MLTPEAWKGTEFEEQVRNDFFGKFGDRRQELVFIGTELNFRLIQNLLDLALLNDQEMSMVCIYNLPSQACMHVPRINGNS